MAVSAIDWVMLARELVVNFLADLCAGSLLALLGAFLAWTVGQKLNLFKRGEERKGRQRRATRRAIEWLLLLKDEIEDLVGKVPQSRGALRSVAWGKVFNISTPIWDLVEQSGELGGVANPDLLRRLARFYHGLSHTKEWVPLIGESWMVDDSRVADVGAKREALIGMAVQGLDQARKAGAGLAAELDSEVDRLRARLTDLGGDVPPDGEGSDGEEKRV